MARLYDSRNLEHLLNHVVWRIKIQCCSALPAVFRPWTFNVIISKSIGNYYHSYGNLAWFYPSYFLPLSFPEWNSINHTKSPFMESRQLPLLEQIQYVLHLFANSFLIISLPVRNSFLAEHFTVGYIHRPIKLLQHALPAVNPMNSNLSRAQAHREKPNENKQTPKNNCIETLLLTNQIAAVSQWGGCVSRHYRRT